MIRGGGRWWLCNVGGFALSAIKYNQKDLVIYNCFFCGNWASYNAPTWCQFACRAIVYYWPWGSRPLETPLRFTTNNANWLVALSHIVGIFIYFIYEHNGNWPEITLVTQWLLVFSLKLTNKRSNLKKIARIYFLR